MLKYLLFILLIVAVCLVVSNHLKSKKIEIAEHANKIDIMNLSGSSVSKSRYPLSSNQTDNTLTKQLTCCNIQYELPNKYSLPKLNHICDLIPIEIACMKKCLAINKEKRIEFGLDVSDRIEEWIEHRLSFKEAICLKIKKEIGAHTEQVISGAMNLESSKSDNRLSKEEVFQLIKSISSNLGLNQMNSFENEILSNNQDTNKFIVNKRGIEILKQMRMLGKLLLEENQDRVSDAKNRDLTSQPANQPINQLINQPINQPKNQPTIQHTNQMNHINLLNQFNQPINRLNNILVNQPPFQIQKSMDKNLWPHYPNLYQNSAPNQFAFMSKKTVESEKIQKKSKDENIRDESPDDYQCVQIKLTKSVKDYLLKTYPNLTIHNMKLERKSVHDSMDDQSKDQRQGRGIFSIFKSGTPAITLKNDQHDTKSAAFDDISAKLIQQFTSSSSHDKILKLASEMTRNNSLNCQQDYLPNISDLLTLNLRLKHLTGDFKRNKSNEIVDVCHSILEIGGKLSVQHQNCKQSTEMESMIKHAFNDTELGFGYCFDFALKHKINVPENETSESAVVTNHDHLLLNETEIKQLEHLNQLTQPNELQTNTNASQENELLNCLNWNNIKSCQDRFIPWFELVEIEELKQLVDNKSIKFNEMYFFKQNVSTTDRIAELSIVDCKSIMLFENCVKENSEDLFAINLEEHNGKLIEKSNSTCQIGLHKINRLALVNRLGIKIINQINQQVSSICPKLNKILSLHKTLIDKDQNPFRSNTIKHFSERFIDLVNDTSCSDSSIPFIKFCVRIYNDHLEPSYVRFYKNFELQTYFSRFFEPNDSILPRICCAQRQLARCFISAANFKCARSKERTIRLLEIGDLSYCDEINSKLSMSKCRSILSIKMNKSTSSSTKLSLVYSYLIFCIFYQVLAFFRKF